MKLGSQGIEVAPGNLPHHFSKTTGRIRPEMEKQESLLKVCPDFSLLFIVPGILLGSLVLTMINLLSKDGMVLLLIAVGAAEIFLILRTNARESWFADLIFLLTPIVTGVLAIAMTHSICWGAPSYFACSTERLHSLPLSNLFLVAFPVFIYWIGYKLSGQKTASPVQTTKPQAVPIAYFIFFLLLLLVQLAWSGTIG